MSSPSSASRRSPRSRQSANEPSSDAPLPSSGVSATSTPSRRDPLATSQQTPSSRGRASAPATDPRTMSMADSERRLGSESSPLRYSQTPVKSQGGTPALTPARRSDINRTRRPQMFDPASMIHTSDDDRMQMPGSQDAPPSDRTASNAGANNNGNYARAVIWGTNVNVQETMDAFRRFLNDFRDEESGEFVYARLLEEIRATERYFLELDCMNLHAFDKSLYLRMVRYPQEIIPIFDMVAEEVYKTMFPNEPPLRPIQVRTYNLETTKNMRLLNPDDVDQLISIRGMVIRTSTVIPDLKEAFFRCSVCHETKAVEIDRGRIEEPSRCPSCDTLRSMQLVHNRCTFADKQMVKLQETPEMIPEGQTPHTALLLAYDDLVDYVQPGDRIEVTGIYRATPLRVNPRDRTLKSIYKIHIDVVHFKKTDKRRMARAEGDETSNNVEDRISPEREGELKALSRLPDIYDRLTRALAPSIWELADVKKGILCQLFGGTNKVMKEAGKGRLRGEVNILLCGDPGTSKSQLLQYVHKLAPRGIYTSGKGSSSVGLTAYVTKDPESRQLVLESISGTRLNPISLSLVRACVRVDAHEAF
eukprot:Opistho-2@49187